MLKKIAPSIMLLLLLIPACTKKQDLVEKAFDGKNFDRVLPPTEQDKPKEKPEEKEEDEKTKIEVLVDNIEEPRQDSVFTKTGLPDRVKPNIFKNNPEAPLLNFEDAKLYDVIYSLCELLGVNFIIDPSVKDQTVTINMVRSDKKLLTSDLFDLLLKLHDLTIVQHESFISIVPIASPDVNPGLELLHGTRANKNLRNEEVVMQIIPLRYVAPADVNTVIKEFMSTSARIYEEPKNNVLILVDKYQHIAKAMELIPIFDVDLLANKKLVFYELAHVDATEVANKLKDILSAYGFEEDGERLAIVPIETLNGILVVTNASSIFKEIDFWVQKFDKEGQFEEEQVFIYKVENTTAYAISSTISQIYDLRTGTTGGGLGGSSGSRRSTSAFGNNSGLNNNSRSNFGNNRGNLNNNRSNLNNSRDNVNNSRANLNNDNNSRGGLNTTRNNNRNNFVQGNNRTLGSTSNNNSDGPLMIVDEDNNSLIFQTTQREYSRIFKTLRKLDVLPRQVFLEVTVLSVSLSDNFKFGLNWSFNPSQRASGSSSSVLPVAFNGAVPNADGSSGFATGGIAGAYSYVGATGTLLANVEALKQNGYANLLQQPHIMAIDNQSASISVGTDVPIQTSTTNISNIATGGSTTPAVSSNIQYRSTGVNLTFTPHINANGVIRLEIALDISDPGEVSGEGAPPISQNSLQTEMIVRDNQTVVMGGLILDQESWSKDSVPLLGRLPLLKHLFTDRSSNMKKSELIVMITPRLIDSEEKSIAISKEFKEKILKEFESFKRSGF